ncbi:MAG TPA: hypothetical protein VK140_17415 [Ktedonobacteraceae bacterium]|nr:hypothetical protein [Ktedonobacteraceae bacterium]
MEKKKPEPEDELTRGQWHRFKTWQKAIEELGAVPNCAREVSGLFSEQPLYLFIAYIDEQQYIKVIDFQS